MPKSIALRPFLCWTTDLRAEIIEAITSKGAAERFVAESFSGPVFVTPATGDEHHRALFAGGTSLLALDCAEFAIVSGLLVLPASEVDDDEDTGIIDEQTGRPVPFSEVAGMRRVDETGWLRLLPA